MYRRLDGAHIVKTLASGLVIALMVALGVGGLLSLKLSADRGP